MKTLERLADQITLELLLPALVLAFMLLGLVLILWKAQKRPDFDIAGFLRDDSGKESAFRAFAFVALGVTSWIITVMTLRNQLQPEYFLYYCLTWANTVVLVELAKRWNGVFPFGSQRSGYMGPVNSPVLPSPDAPVPPLVQAQRRGPLSQRNYPPQGGQDGT